MKSFYGTQPMQSNVALLYIYLLLSRISIGNINPVNCGRPTVRHHRVCSAVLNLSCRFTVFLIQIFHSPYIPNRMILDSMRGPQLGCRESSIQTSLFDPELNKPERGVPSIQASSFGHQNI